MARAYIQWEFLKDVAVLLQYADRRGYMLTGGDLYRDSEYALMHASGVRSRHHHRCAIDLNLFVGGEYQSSTAAHAELGQFWESLSVYNRWGGRFDDGNHYERLDTARGDVNADVTDA